MLAGGPSNPVTIATTASPRPPVRSLVLTIRAVATTPIAAAIKPGNHAKPANSTNLNGSLSQTIWVRKHYATMITIAKGRLATPSREPITAKEALVGLGRGWYSR